MPGGMVQMIQPELMTVRPGDDLDWASLEDYLRARLEDIPAGPLQVLQFPRGSANLTYKLAFDDLQLVLRRPPFGKTAPGAHDMAREFRVLSHIWRAYPRAPRVYAFCEDVSVIGAPFVVQEYRSDGVVIFEGASADFATLPDVGIRLTQAMVEALADLHEIDFRAVGLADFGRPEGYLQRQLSGWRDRWSRVASADCAVEMEQVASRLESETPNSSLISLIHNDYKLDNCQFRPGAPDSVASVFDWDMATLGDPLVDVGITLAYWSDVRRRVPLGLPPKDVFARLYAERVGIDLATIGWYEAFACWRNAVVIQQLYDRRLRGDSHDDRAAQYGRAASALAARAVDILDGREA